MILPIEHMDIDYERREDGWYKVFTLKIPSDMLIHILKWISPCEIRLGKPFD